MVAVKLAGPLQAGLDGIEDGVALGDGVDEGAQFADLPVAEADAVRGEAASESDAFPNAVCQAALTPGIVAIGAIAVGHQPADEGFADQGLDLLMTAAADVEDGGGCRGMSGLMLQI